MDQIGDRKFVEIPGSGQHELPPLLLRGVQQAKNLNKMMILAQEMIDREDMLLPCLSEEPAVRAQDHDRRKLDLALNLVERYLDVKRHWAWGDSVLEWIKQCEWTFQSRFELRTLLRSDVWPHAGRSSFVALLEDKSVGSREIALMRAVGLRLAFREMPPLRYCSDQFLFYLNGSLAANAYRTWSEMNVEAAVSFPPERFAFEVVDLQQELAF